MALSSQQRVLALKHLGKLTKFMPRSSKGGTAAAHGDAASSDWNEASLSPVVAATFHESVPAAIEAYRFFNRNYPKAEAELHTDIVARAVEFGYMRWPRKIRHYVWNKDVLDVGCGRGVHGVGYILVGAKSYTGMDPILELDLDRAKNVRTGAADSFGWTPRQIMAKCSRITLLPATFESFPSDSSFDVAVLHNVTEHLIEIDEVMGRLASYVKDGGLLIFNHHNFYCWNGHHMRPKRIDQIDPSKPEQKQFMDWAHISFEPPKGHYISRGLNKIRLDDLKALVSRDYKIEIWDEIPSNALNGGERLTDQIVAKFPELTRRDLQVHNVFCVARRTNVG